MPAPHVPPTPPAIVQQAPARPVLSDIMVISNGMTYRIPVQGVPCASNVVFVSRVVKEPSKRMTVSISCDGPNATLELPDDPVPAPNNAALPKAKK